MYTKNFASPIVFEILKFSKILESDWLRVFSPITRETNFSKTCDLYRIIKTTMEYHYGVSCKPKKSIHQ